MDETPLWKPLLILLVLGLCGLMLWFPGQYGPGERLKPGIDLAGGTTLIYEVDVPEDRDASSVIDETIDTLRQRVDPQGVRNLVWRKQAGNRIEIQMALAPPEVTRRREAFIDAREALFSARLSAQQLDSALRAEPERRQALFESLSGGEEVRREALRKLARRFDRLVEARRAYRKTQAEYRSVRIRVDEMEAAQEEAGEGEGGGGGASEAGEAGEAGAAPERLATERELREALRQELETQARTFNEVKAAYESARASVLAGNVSAEDFERVLAMPDEPRPGESVSPRERGVQELIEKYPTREKLIREAVEAYEHYDEVRGPLDDPHDLMTLLQGSGVLEYRIGASPDQVDAEAFRQQLREQGPRSGRDRAWRWFEIDDIGSFADTKSEQEALREDPEGFLAGRGLVGAGYGDKIYVLLANTPEKTLTHAKAGWELTRVGRTTDQNGMPAVSFNLNTAGGQHMAALTGNHVNEPMAILLDGRVISAPNINSRIGASGIITGGRGGFGQAELDYLLRTLRAGSIEGTLSEEPISIQTTGPRFGQDNLEAGLNASILALVLVAIFIAFYYLFWGLVADFALVANMVVILGVMALLEATFTLPGIAGIVLTIGMAVDANVLIFERIREELAAGRKLHTAIRLGYDKALSTVLDANITTLITCIVLGYTATAEVKGFATTLGIGILATLFTSLFCSRVVIDLYVRRMQPKSLPMLPTLLPSIDRILTPSVDWVRKRGIFWSLSAVLIVLSLASLYGRGQDMLDIEFRSGTQVSFELAEGEQLELGEARRRLTEVAEAMGEPLLAGDRVSLATVGRTEGAKASGFTIATLVTDTERVSRAIKTAFEDVVEARPPVRFEKDEVERLGEAPVYPIREARLGASIDRPGVENDVSAYLGGVAVVMEGLDPAVTIAEVEERLQQMQMQPAFEHLGYRQFEVIGLDLAQAAGEGGGAEYQAVVVVAHDGQTSYVENPDTFDQSGGLAATQWDLVREAMRRDTSLGSVSNFSSQVSRTMKQQAIVALSLSLLAVVAYIWLRFGSLRYGLAAIAALVHDVILGLGAVAASAWLAGGPIGTLLGVSAFRIDLAMVAAVLTIIGYSLNDTIVVFDRVRENRGRQPTLTAAVVNRSINQTFSRTMLTSSTTLLALLLLYFFGGAGVQGFAFAMVIGVLSGTCSSIAVASPLLLVGPGDEPVAEGEKAVAVK